MSDPGYNVVQFPNAEAGLGNSRENPPLRGDGGGGTSDDMEARIARLEAHMEHVLEDVKAMKSDVGALKTDVAAMKVRIENLPTKEWISTTLRNWVGFAVAITALISFAVNMLPKLLGH